MKSKTTLDRRTFLASTLAAGLGARVAGAALDHSVGLSAWQGEGALAHGKSAIAIADPARIRLLQVTDIHYFCKQDQPESDVKTSDDLKRYVDTYAPDVLLVTGDLWHNNPQGQGAEYMAFAIGQLESLGVPWLFTWGNHDLLRDYSKGHAAMTQGKNSLYRGGPGGGCYLVGITDKTGAPLWDLVCLNSMTGGLALPQRKWLADLKNRSAEELTAKHAFGLFHIPVKQYDDIWRSRVASGVKFEEVCFEEEDGSALAGLKALGTIRACFVGHDHVNDYSGAVDGIELAYGRATGYGGYGEEKVPKGAKLITVNAESGQYAWQTVYPDGATWVPDPGKQIDVYEETPWAQQAVH